MIELYDLGRTTHGAIPGMYQFIVDNAQDFVDDRLTKELKDQAKLRERKGHSIPQEYFSKMCNIWVEAHKQGTFQIDFSKVIYEDTIPRFQRARQLGREIAVLSSASRDFTELFYDITISPGKKLSDLVGEYFLGEEIGDKDLPETHARLWEKTRGGIYAIFDDKPSVCNAAKDGIDQAGGNPKIYLVDRKEQYTGEVLEELTEKGIINIKTFDEVQD